MSNIYLELVEAANLADGSLDAFRQRAEVVLGKPLNLCRLDPIPGKMKAFQLFVETYEQFVERALS